VFGLHLRDGKPPVTDDIRRAVALAQQGRNQVGYNRAILGDENPQKQIARRLG
jgi:hypothetical protein